MKLRKRFCCLCAAALLSLTMLVPASAAPQYGDLPTSHWAYDDMTRCAELGIISGIGNGNMGPSVTLTWGQYLTMLSRTFNARAYTKKLDQGVAWDQAGYEVALKLNLVEKNDDVLTVDETTLGEPITRRDVAVLLSRALPKSVKGSYDADDYPLSDLDGLDKVSRKAVERMVELGITRGKTDGTFGGQDTLMRSDGSVMLLRALEQYDKSYRGEDTDITLTFVDTDGNVVKETEVESYVQQSYYTLADKYMPKYYTYVGGSGYVSTACESYTLTVQAMDTKEIEEAEAWEAYYDGDITWEELMSMDFWLYVQGGTYAKYERLFGSTDKWRFSNKAEAEANMTRVTVPIWKLSGGQKVSSKATLTIHKALAEDVVNIFTDIYNDPEQFPISSVGAYNWRGDTSTSEHCSGTAIDINPNENYQVWDGQAMTGSFWDPEASVYSIPEDGSVVKIFAKYGWTWGGDAWAWGTNPNEGYHDYMHFSYLGG